MFKLSDLKKTMVYREAKVEGKLEAVPGFLALGLSVEQIALALGLEVSVVERVAAGEVVLPESLVRENGQEGD